MFRNNFKKKIALLMIVILICVYFVPTYLFAGENTDPGTEIVDGIVDIVTDGDPKVREAQQWLNDTYNGQAGYTQIDVNGYTGFTTVKALTIALQIELGLGSSSTGTFGPTTTAKCPTISKSNPGSNSRIVRILQHALFCKGYGAYDDYGTFGTETEKAVNKLESDAGLEPTGVVTPMIFKAILNTDGLVLSIYGDFTIRYIQQSLNKNFNQYFGIIPCDGIYGRSTNTALIYALQALEGLSTTVANGFFGPTTKSLCPSLEVGDSRKGFVLLLQYVLYCNGYGTQVNGPLDIIGTFDGVYGDKVKSAVTSFQEFMCLKVTGNADKGTLMSLFTTCGDSSRSALACDTSTRINAVNVKTIKNAGYTHIGRYLTSYLGMEKGMTNEEIQIILDAGLSIFPIYQTYGGAVNYYTKAQAKEDAMNAESAAKYFDFPEDTTLYFAVDYDAYDYQVTDAILPYFNQLNETMEGLGIHYNIGIYAPRNVCSRVTDAGYAKYCFVSDASSGFSGNLGYSMPKKWAYDQFSTDIWMGSGDGKIAIDKTAYSSRDKGVSSLDKNLSSVNEAYLMMESLRHTNSLLSWVEQGGEVDTDDSNGIDTYESNKAATENYYKMRQNAFYVMHTMRSNKIIKDNPYVMAYITTRLLNGNKFNYDDIKNIKASLMTSDNTAKKCFDIWEQLEEAKRNSMVLNIVPLIGDLKGFFEGVSGKDALTGRNLAWWERVVGVTCGVLEAKSIVSVAKVYLQEAEAAPLALELAKVSKNSEIEALAKPIAEEYSTLKNSLINSSDQVFADVKSVSSSGEELKIITNKGTELSMTESTLVTSLEKSGLSADVAKARVKCLKEGCFTGDTLVTTKTGLKRIDEIAEGEYVLAKDVNSDITDYKEVLYVYRKTATEFVHLNIGDDIINTTPNHLFFTTSGQWVAAKNLKAGDKIATASGGMKEIVSVEFEITSAPVKIFNLNVEGFHTYFVGSQQALVHNNCLAEMMAAGREAIENARLRGLTNSNELSNIGEAAANAVDKAIGQGITDSVELARIGKVSGEAAESLKYFAPNGLTHIFKGEIKGTKSMGWHYEPGTTIGRIVSIVQPPNSQGVYEAVVEIGGIQKVDTSTFFPKTWSKDEVMSAIYEAYRNANPKVKADGTEFVYKWTGTSRGITIDMFLDADAQIVSAFPKL